MPSAMFVNLPIDDLARTRAFWTELGMSFDERFGDKKAACLIVNDQAYVMLLQRDFFATFTGKQIADATATTEVILALSVDSREAVNALVDKALAAGGKPSQDPLDSGCMYGWSFQDIDDHLWEVFWMDPQGPPQ